ncbi:hypothetical protein NL676_021638 [Syzygium grande]|nr:hypothetical protein NL676_021638 [Syzygium grande]
MFSIYYYYCNGYEDVIKNVTSQSCDTTSFIQLPGLPQLTDRNVPSFFNLENKYVFLALPKLQSQFQQLKEGGNPKVVLVNTYNALELEVLRAIGTLHWVEIGPLVPFRFLDAKNHNSYDKFCRGDLFRGSEEYVQWLNSKEMFLYSLGWNSTLESLVCGIPMVAFPQFGDQITNSKLVKDVWKVGVRVTKINEEGIFVEGGEIKKCLKLVMGGGQRGDGIRKNAKKCKDLAMESSKEGGSSDKNLEAFVEEFAKVKDQKWMDS